MSWNESEFLDQSQTFVKSSSAEIEIKTDINTSGDDKELQSTISPSSSIDSTNTNQPSTLLIANKKSPRKRSIPKDPSSSTNKPLKHRKEEHLPMPSASSNPSSADDPVLSAVPLGKSNTRTSFKKINLVCHFICS
jgi:hypothetical protein